MPLNYHRISRKKEVKNTEVCLTLDKNKIFIDKLVCILGVMSPIFTLPQLTTIWVSHDVSGVSLFSWSSYLVMSFVFSIYAFLHKEKPLLIMYVSSVILNTLIVVGIIFYGFYL